MDCSEGCPTAAVIFGVCGVRVLAAERDPVGLELTVGTDQTLEGCRRCGVLAVPHDPRLTPGRFGQGREVTCMVDLSRDANGQVRGRLLDLVLGRSGPAYARWLDARQPPRAQIKHAALDPFRGYANALRDSLPDTLQVLDAFTCHVTSSSSALRSSKRSGVASSRSNCTAADTVTTRSTRSAGCSGTARSTCPSARTPGSLPGSPAATHTARSSWPGPATSSFDRSTPAPSACASAAHSPTRSSPASRPARSPRSPGAAAPCAPGEPRS